MNNNVRRILLRVTLCVIAFGTGLYMLFAFTIPNASIYDDMKLDSAIVFGARSYRNDEYNPCLVARVEKAIRLYNNKKVEKLILTGGTDREDGSNEAETMQKIALEKGVLPEDILLEKKATSSYENLVFSKELMEKEDINSAFLVSEPFHVTRIELVARSLGMWTVPSAAENSPCWTKWKYFSRYFLKEPLAIMQYILMGKIKPEAFLMFDRK